VFVSRHFFEHIKKRHRSEDPATTCHYERRRDEPASQKKVKAAVGPPHSRTPASEGGRYQASAKEHLLGAHQEEGLVGEAGILRAKALGVVLFFYVDEFFRGGDGADGHVVVAALFEDHETAESFIEN